MQYSCIIPCYNSEKSIEEVVSLIKLYFNEINVEKYEIILVNDCSSDRTFDKIENIVNNNTNVIGIDLAKNAGQHNALLTGMSYSTGDFVISLDDDLQTQPSQIGKLIKTIEEGYDVVYGSYSSMKQSGFRNLGAMFNHLTIQKLLKKPKDLKASSFWIARRFVIEYIIQGKSNFTNLQGLFLRTTDKITNVEIQHFNRVHGSSTYTLKKLIRLWASCINYSYLPLRWIIKLGVLFLILSLISYVTVFCIYCLHIIIDFHFYLILITLTFFSSLILLSLGIVSEYIGRMFMVVTKEPQQTIRRVIRHSLKQSDVNLNLDKII